MHKPLNLLGQRYGRLVVVKLLGKDKYYHKVWLCQCDCGSTSEVTTSDLRCGRVNSCGCYKRQNIINKNTTHNKSKSTLYRIFSHMKERCYVENNQDYSYYGARGINICAEWLNCFESFYQWALDNGYCEGLTIDRIDVNANYAPKNCRWVTMKVQSNNKRNTIHVTHNQQTKSLADWASITGIKYSTLYYRYQKGYQEKDLFKL